MATLTDYGTLRFWLDATHEVSYTDGSAVTTFYDRSGNTRNFTGESSPIKTNSGPAYSTPSVYLNGGSRFVRTESGLFNNGGFTVIFLLRLSALPVTNNMFVFDTGLDSTDNRKSLQILTTGAVLLSLDGGGGSMESSPGVIKANEWTILCVTVRGASSTIKVNGAIVATGTISTTLASETPVRIGHRFDATAGAAQNLYISQVVCYTTPLTAENEELASTLIRGTGTLIKQSLVQAMKNDSPTALWTLDDFFTTADGNAILDHSGNNRFLLYDYVSGTPASQSYEVLPGGDPVWNPTTYDYFAKAYESWMSPGSGDWLCTFFFKGSEINTVATDTFESLYSLDLGDSGNGTIIYISNNGSVTYPRGTVRVWYAGSVLQNSIAMQGGKSMLDGDMHQIWVEKRSGTLSIYVDGILCQSAARGAPTNQSGSLYLGTAANGSAEYRQRNSTGYFGLWVASSGNPIPPVSRMHDYRRLATMQLRSGSNSAVAY